MWKIVKGKRLVEEFNIEIEDTWLERDDGFIFIREGATREGVEIFLCKGSFGSFRFMAFRADREAKEIYDRYIVLVKSSMSYWPNSKDKDNEAQILAHARDIESALKNFPLINEYNDIPVKAVLFDINKASERQRHLLSAKELLDQAF